jgi:periplasmic protein TonB
MSTLATTAPSPGFFTAIDLMRDPRSRNSSRNLRLAIGFSLAFHAVVLSLHFKYPDALANAKERALDVILVNSKSARRPLSDVQAKAQANLDGGGNTDLDRRAATPLPVSKQTKEGDSLVEAQRRVVQLQAQQREMMTQLKSRMPVAATNQHSQPMPPAPPTVSGLDLVNSAMAVARLEGQIARNVEEYNKRPRKKFIGARTEEYKPAQYIEDWRQKIERIGNLNYPTEAKGRLSGSLVVYVEIRSDGELVAAEIQRSSGHKVLDDAALRIVRMASPFGAFPADMRQQFDILAFARSWTFTSADKLRAE